MLQIFGNINNPLNTINPSGYGGIEAGGPVKLFTNILRLLFVIGGIWAFLNFILAGYGFLSAGDDPKKIQGAWAKIWQSLVGLLFIVGSFILAVIFGQLIFGDPRAILQPIIYGPGTP